jgi:hypothetical protein
VAETDDMTSRPDRTTLDAFCLFVVFGGANAIGVKFALVELAPAPATPVVARTS